MSSSAVDLARVAVGAYLADKLIYRSSTQWSRDIQLVIHLRDPQRFEGARVLVEQLLYFVSGDSWTITGVQDTSDFPREVPPHEPVLSVSLLSGGLDSLCGALLSDNRTQFLGHWESPAVAHAQRLIEGDLREIHGSILYERVHIRSLKPREASSRTRSVMFNALGVALAVGRGADKVIVPENGFTSLNPPLGADRGGPHTTRSTHPTTFAYTNAINRALGIDVEVANPYQWMTKGELVRLVVERVGHERMREIIPHTFSCARGNGHFFKGGNAQANCGVCVACMVRRGAIRTVLTTDPTEYLCDRLTGQTLQEFMRLRGKDVDVVRAFTGWEPGDADVVALGPFPQEYDLEKAKFLMRRGIEELCHGLP